MQLLTTVQIAQDPNLCYIKTPLGECYQATAEYPSGLERWLKEQYPELMKRYLLFWKENKIGDIFTFAITVLGYDYIIGPPHIVSTTGNSEQKKAEYPGYTIE